MYPVPRRLPKDHTGVSTVSKQLIKYLMCLYIVSMVIKTEEDFFFVEAQKEQ